jgi:hypothetical protein
VEYREFILQLRAGFFFSNTVPEEGGGGYIKDGFLLGNLTMVLENFYLCDNSAVEYRDGQGERAHTLVPSPFLSEASQRPYEAQNLLDFNSKT